jgi:hypothetical protein
VLKGFETRSLLGAEANAATDAGMRKAAPMSGLPPVE